MPANVPDYTGPDNQPKTSSLARQGRTIDEVSGLKSARQSEIERRALLLDPPIQPSTLHHMSSFQAAIQLISPLDDRAWKLLEPKILAQKAEAEREETENAISVKQENDATGRLEVTLASTKEARNLIDKSWEDVQAPVRTRIASYADALIRDSWNKGEGVSKDNCSRFASDVLTYVRRRFYAQVAEGADMARRQNEEIPADAPEGPYTQKLTLENMKWVFDTKVRPLTEPLKKELFFCNGCENNSRAYGFEGVIQHYAAKHTSALSLGSVVVHWRAEWPAKPPFTSQPRTQSDPYHISGSHPFPPPMGSAPPFTFNGYQGPEGMSNMPPPHTQAFPPLGEAYDPSTYVDYYPPPPAYPYPADYATPSGYPPPQSFQTQPAPAPAPIPYPSYPPGLPPPPQSQQPLAPEYYSSHPAPNYPPQQPATAQPQDQGFTYPPPSQYHYSSGLSQGNGQINYATHPSQEYLDNYQNKLEDIAINSREVWNTTAHTKELPGSVRVFVTIYHTAKRFRARFSESPSLELFNDGLSNHKDMRPVRNINALLCKACHFGLGNAPYLEPERKTFSLPQLVNHFQSKHIEPVQLLGAASHLLDWTVDMVLLPDPPVLAKIPRIADSDSQKHYLFAEAFPQLFQQHTTPTAAPYYQIQPPHQPAPSYPGSYPPIPIDGDGLDYSQQPLLQPLNGHVPLDATNGGGQAIAPPQTHQPSDYQTDTQHGRTADHSRNSKHSIENNGILNREPGRKKKKKSKRARQKSRQAIARLEHHPVKEEEKEEATGVEAGEAEEEEKAREEEIKAMWAADRTEAAHAYISPSQPKANGTLEQPEPAEISPSRTQPLSRTKTPDVSSQPISSRRDSPLQEEPSLLDALEMHLKQDQSRSVPDRGRHSSSSEVIYSSDKDLSTARAAPVDPEKFLAYPPSTNNRSSSPPRVQYRQPPRETEGYRKRSPLPSQFKPRYLSRPPPEDLVEEVRYERLPQPAPGQYDQYEPIVHQSGFYSRSESVRQEENIIYETPPSTRRMYLRSYHDNSPPPPPSRAPVEAYEIVRVADAQGSYYIRRPARRDQEFRYAYEDEMSPLRRGSEPSYQGYERAYSRGSAHPPSSFEPTDEPLLSRIARPDYLPIDDEYDPRFPAAPPGGAPAGQVRYQ